MSWPRGSRPAISGARKIPAARNDRRDEEDRQLHVPGARQVVGEHLGEVDAEEAVRARRGSAGDAAPTRVWSRNSAATTRKNQARGALRRASAPRRRARGSDSVACSRPVPAEDAPAAEGREQDPDAAEQRDQREHGPDDHVGGGRVADQRLGRPVVRVRVVLARPLARRRPGRPGEERRQLVDLRRGSVIALGPQPVAGRSGRRRSAGSALELLEGARLLRR